MWTDLKLYWLCACLVCLPLSGQVHGAEPHVLKELLADRRCDNYVPATAVQLQHAEAAFVELLQGRGDSKTGQASVWPALGYTARQVELAGMKWQVLQEGRDGCTGQGLYLLREGGSAGLVVQVTHGYHDLHTDEIALGLVNAPVRVIAFNTVPRRFRRQGKEVNADLAHRADNLFAALTRAFARVFPDGRLVQLHGFSPNKRKTAVAADAAAIVSAGKSWSTADSEAVAACLRPLLGGPVLLYPRHVRELGGTRNLHGKLLRRQGHDGFVHVELNRAIRERLRSEDDLRAGFAACLSSGMGSP